MKLKAILPLLVVLALLALLGYGLTQDPAEVPSPLIGKPVPDFDLPGLVETSAGLKTSDLKGQATLINVWASWCVACRDEHAVITELSRQVPVHGLNYKDTRIEAQRWLAHYGNPYSLIGFDKEGSVGIDWGVYGVPETFVVDAQGVIRHKHIGALTADDAEKTILPLIRALQSERDAS